MRKLVLLLPLLLAGCDHDAIFAEQVCIERDTRTPACFKSEFRCPAPMILSGDPRYSTWPVCRLPPEATK